MNFQAKYPILWNFFAAHFPDADFENLTDEQVVAGYKSIVNKEALNKVIEELDRLITDTSCWEQAADDANRYFANQAENLDWLNMVRKGLVG